MHQWFCGKTIINSSVLGSTEKKKGNLFFFLYDLQLQFFLLNFGLEIWEKKGTVTLWQGHIWSRAQLCNTAAHRGHSLGFHVLVSTFLRPSRIKKYYCNSSTGKSLSEALILVSTKHFIEAAAFKFNNSDNIFYRRIIVISCLQNI